jgi:pimeloyl-ACP methyl ester carboxylesterase
MAVLLGSGTLLASIIYLWALWRDTMHPPRRTMAWALAHGQTAHPEDLSLATSERKYPRVDGGETPCWIVRGNQVHGTVVTILLHGHGRSRWDSLRRLPGWIDRSSVVVMPDLRGHGDAEGNTTLGRQEGRDIVLLMNELAVEHPGARFTLVGHSMGAVVAIHAAAHVARNGPPVDLVEAIGPYDAVGTPLRARLRARGLPSGIYARAVLRLVRTLHGPETRTSTAAAALVCPINLLADTLDEVSPAADARAIAARAAHATVHITQGVAHADLGVPPPPLTPPSQASPTADQPAPSRQL